MALLEVVTAVVPAQLLLQQLLGTVQLAGGVGVLVGLATGELGEPRAV